MRGAGDAEGSFPKLWWFAWFPNVSEAIAINKQSKRKDANSVFVEERPDLKIEFYNSDAAALAHCNFAIRCLYRDWDRYILIVNFSFFVSVLGSTK